MVIGMTKTIGKVVFIAFWFALLYFCFHMEDFFMTDREKLIELLCHKYDHFCDQCGVNEDSHYIDSLADYLISNGVTFAKDTNVPSWIPASERLPENDEPYEEYLVNIMEDHFPCATWDDDPYCTERVTVAQFDDKQKLWYLHGGNTALNALILPEHSRVNSQSVTHWMPLPEPPKEK
jgi:hypothetical protein